MSKIKKLVEIIYTAAIGAGLLYLNFADTSAYGRKTNFPDRFYEHSKILENISPYMRQMYLDGHISEDFMQEILDRRNTSVKNK